MSKILLIAMLAGSAFDIGSTETALRLPGLHEANPLMQNRGVRISVNIMAPIMLHRMIRDKPIKTQLAVALPWIGLKVFAGTHNIRLTQKEREKRK